MHQAAPDPRRFTEDDLEHIGRRFAVLRDKGETFYAYRKRLGKTILLKTFTPAGNPRDGNLALALLTGIKYEYWNKEEDLTLAFRAAQLSKAAFLGSVHLDQALEAPYPRDFRGERG